MGGGDGSACKSEAEADRTSNFAFDRPHAFAQQQQQVQPDERKEKISAE
jgi:hypothetical protein